MQATIFDLQRFSVHDGPGIRTTVFFKGCNLHCFWCHNPESIHPGREVEFLPVKCIGCGKCFEICPNQCHVMKDGVRYFEREKCIACGRCTDRCYAEALTMMGKTYTPEEVIPYVDLFLYDLKCMDDEAHVKAVGVHNQLIKENIKKLSDAGILPALYGCWKECKMLRF